MVTSLSIAIVFGFAFVSTNNSLFAYAQQSNTSNSSSQSDAAETVLGYFGFDRTAYSNIKKGRSKKWYEELKEQDKGHRS